MDGFEWAGDSGSAGKTTAVSPIVYPAQSSQIVYLNVLNQKTPGLLVSCRLLIAIQFSLLAVRTIKRIHRLPSTRKDKDRLRHTYVVLHVAPIGMRLSYAILHFACHTPTFRV
jgi:hypothetical protein